MRTVELKFKENDELLTGIYKNNKIAFALCSPEENGVVEQIVSYYYCRESVVGAIPNLVKDKKISTRNTWISIHKPLATGDATKANESLTKAFEQQVKNAIKLVNHYEKRNKWLLSKLYLAKHKHDGLNRAYIIKGSRWWITSPHMLSLYMLLMRIAEQKQFNAIKSTTPNKKIIEWIRATPEDNRDYDKTRDAAMWNVLLDNRRQIFGKKGAKQNFHRDYGGHEGVQSLTTGRCNDRTTFVAFEKLCKEAKVS